jgi:peptide/nickel transport system permease protein
MLAQGAGSISASDLQQIRGALGLNRPFSHQYLSFLIGLMHGDLGRSFVGNMPVETLVAHALPLTLSLAFVSLVLSLLIAVPMGVHAAVHRGSFSDHLIRVLSLTGLSFPNFRTAMMLVLLFSVVLGWLPPSGAQEPSGIVLPSLTMAIILAATNVRLIRTTMLETLSAQYIMVARAKGLSEWTVLYKHALRNCAVPLVTYIGLQFGNLIGGLVVVERVFDWPGMGTLAFEAVAARDYSVLQGTIAILAILIVTVNLLTDILYAFFDPRIRIR